MSKTKSRIGRICLSLQECRVERSARLENKILQRERNELQRLLASERTRIARDMDDELGTGLTSLCRLSQLMHFDKMLPAMIEAHSQKIAHQLSQLARSLDEIVWAVNPCNDTLHSLVQYLAHYSNEFSLPAPVRCHLDFPAQVPAVQLPFEIRRHAFVAFRDVLNDVLQHAAVSEVKIGLNYADGILVIEISGKGHGVDLAAGKAGALGNRLESVRERMESIRGSYRCESMPGRAVQVTLTINLPQPMQI